MMPIPNTIHSQENFVYNFRWFLVSLKIIMLTGHWIATLDISDSKRIGIVKVSV